MDLNLVKNKTVLCLTEKEIVFIKILIRGKIHRINYIIIKINKI